MLGLRFHQHDKKLEKMLTKLGPLPEDISPYNGSFASEYELSFDTTGGNCIQRNYRCLARRMLKHLAESNMDKKLGHKNTIRILSIGCRYGFDIIPLLLFFKEAGINIKYYGIDINPKYVTANKKTFQSFNNITFKQGDIRLLNFNQPFDLIVCQHPNFQNPNYASAFEKIFTSTIPQHLAENGALYTSLYYTQEFDYFRENIYPKIKDILGGQLIDNSVTDSLTMADRSNPNFTYSPERYVYTS